MKFLTAEDWLCSLTDEEFERVKQEGLNYSKFRYMDEGERIGTTTTTDESHENLCK